MVTGSGTVITVNIHNITPYKISILNTITCILIVYKGTSISDADRSFLSVAGSKNSGGS